MYEFIGTQCMLALTVSSNRLQTQVQECSVNLNKVEYVEFHEIHSLLEAKFRNISSIEESRVIGRTFHSVGVSELAQRGLLDYVELDRNDLLRHPCNYPCYHTHLLHQREPQA